MRSSKLSARRGLLAAAGALTALLAAAPVAGAVSYKNGPVDFSGLKLGIKVNKVTAPAKKEGTKGFELPVTGGNATLNTAPTGTISEGGSVELKIGSKRATFSEFKETFSGNKVVVSAKLGGKTVNLFEGTITNKITVAADFSSLAGKSIQLTVSSKGAAGLNRAFGLKKPKKGRKDKRIKKGQKVGTKSFDAHRSLTVSGGDSALVYDQAFYDAMQGCGISLTPVAPATAIPTSSTAPRGGQAQPAVAGTIDAVDGKGSFTLGGGTHLEDPDTKNPDPSGPGGPHSSDLTNFVVDTTVAPPTLIANASDLGGAPLQIATVEGSTFAKTLTDSGGSVSLTNGNTKLTSFAQSALASLYGCTTIPAGSSLGIVNVTLQVT